MSIFASVNESTTAPRIQSTNLNANLAASLLTNEEKEGTVNVHVYLEIDGLTEEEISLEDKELVETYLEDKHLDKDNCIYMDISLWKQVGINEAIKVSNIVGNKLTFSLEVPDSIKKAPVGYIRSFTLLRIHDGEVKEVTSSRNTVLTGSTDEFSTYVIAFKDVRYLVPDTHVG